MNGFFIEIGRRAEFSKTVAESDVYLFAGITGDLAPNHVDEAFMSTTRYGRRIAHGALMIGFMSNASTRILDGLDHGDYTAVSLGYDRIRFLKPVYIGDTIKVIYQIEDIDEEKNRSYALCEVFNQEKQLVTTAKHILKWVST